MFYMKQCKNTLKNSNIRAAKIYFFLILILQYLHQYMHKLDSYCILIQSFFVMYNEALRLNNECYSVGVSKLRHLHVLILAPVIFANTHYVCEGKYTYSIEYVFSSFLQGLYYKNHDNVITNYLFIIYHFYICQNKYNFGYVPILFVIIYFIV